MPPFLTAHSAMSSRAIVSTTAAMAMASGPTPISSSSPIIPETRASATLEVSEPPASQAERI
eukprot:5203276-Alexandrium_andersonii.AAC.1